jgi:gas vesicle protein
MAMSLGAAFGPWGIAIGLVIGAIMACINVFQKAKEAEEARKKALEETTKANVESIQELSKTSKENMDAEKKAREAIEDYQSGELSYEELQGVLDELPEGF